MANAHSYHRSPMAGRQLTHLGQFFTVWKPFPHHVTDIIFDGVSGAGKTEVTIAKNNKWINFSFEAVPVPDGGVPLALGIFGILLFGVYSKLS